MSRASRGGLTLKTGKIGRVNCLRQQILMPGERQNVSINGSIRLESLRERDVMRINAHLGVFMTPLRWLVSDFPDYVKEGMDTAKTIPTQNRSNWADLGIGSYTVTDYTHLKHFQDSALQVYNRWYKWPESADATSWDTDGNKAVPLSQHWNRCRFNATPVDTDDYQIDVSGATMDVRTLAETEAKFRGAMKRDILSYNRWMELVDQVWKGDGSREVDKVPLMLDQVEVGVRPREIPATDGASLGQWQSLFDFNVNHQIRGIVAPEHCIVTYMLTVRFAPTIESCMPLATNYLDWYEMVGDPEFLSSAMPRSVTLRDFSQTTDATSMGYLPAGWQWRCDHDVVGQRIDLRDSFPMMNTPTTQAEAKDATRVKDAFRSQALGDYLVDVYFNEDSIQPIGDSMDSYFSGMADSTSPGVGRKNDEFPHGGKML